MQLGHHIWNVYPRPQIAFEGVFEYLLNPGIVVVFVRLPTKKKDISQVSASLCTTTNATRHLIWDQIT
jgi:hypothetical protein